MSVGVKVVLKEDTQHLEITHLAEGRTQPLEFPFYIGPRLRRKNSAHGPQFRAQSSSAHAQLMYSLGVQALADQWFVTRDLFDVAA